MRLIRSVKYLLVIVFILSSYFAQATHIVGGEISLEHLAGATFKLSLHLYSDDINGNPGAIDPSVTIWVYERGTNRLVTSYDLPQTTATILNPSPLACTTATFRTKYTLYTTNAVLDAQRFSSPRGYYMAWARCCRNNQIQNIEVPEDAATVFYLEFPALNPTTGNPNSSPRFKTPAADFACINYLFQMDFSATDIDGDSLSYEMVTPINGPADKNTPNPNSSIPGPYDSITWKPRFSANAAIIGNPSLGIDATTGKLIVKTPTQGLFVFGIVVYEWRNKRIIGQVKRDFQLTVRDCPDPPAITSLIALPEKPLKEPSSKNRYDTMVIRYSDSNTCAKVALFGFGTQQPVNIGVLPQNYSNNILTVSPLSGVLIRPTDTLFLNLCSSQCSPDSSQIYLTKLALSVDGCPKAATDTINLAIRIIPAPRVNNLRVNVIENSTIDIKANDLVDINVQATSSDSPSAILLSADFDYSDSATKAMVDTNHLPFYNIRFRPTSGIGKTSSKFRWEVNCDTYLQFVGKNIKIKVKALTINNCVDTVRDSTYITLQIEPFPPGLDSEPYNVLTPNGDGLNDKFFMPFTEYACRSSVNKIEIYNRWGNKIFASDNPYYEWYPVNEPAGLYYYYAYYREYIYKGWIQVIK